VYFLHNDGIMLPITPAHVTPNLRALFDTAMPASLRCFGVLEGIVAGEILTDDPHNPTWGAVREANDGTLYVGGALDSQRLAQLVAHLRQTGDVLIGYWPDDEAFKAMLPPNLEYEGDVLEFYECSLDTNLLSPLPDGCTIRRMDADLFARSLDRDYHLAGGLSADDVLARGIGCCLLHGDDILCEAFAGAAINGIREMGVVTLEAYRKRGYAALTCAHLIHLCAQAGQRTYWNCAKQNLASTRLARKLGYRNEREYQLVAWFKSSLADLHEIE
jgi:RimJ/RimL family protein N-acetyltransferase